MIRPQPMIVVTDVAAVSRWFPAVLGLTSGHGGAEYEMLMDGSEVVAQLHLWEADFDAIMGRVETTGATVLDGPLKNPNSGQREVWLRGPEGFVVVAAGA